jgi:hypothetical protein
MMFGAASPMLVSLLGDAPEMSADARIDRYLLLKSVDKELRSLSPADREAIASQLAGPGEYLGDYADLISKIGKMGSGALKSIRQAAQNRKARKNKSKSAAAASRNAPAVASSAAAAVAPGSAAKRPMAVWILPAALGAAALVAVLTLTRRKG